MAGESISWKTYLAARAPATPPLGDDVLTILQGGTDVKKLRWEDLVRGVANYCEDTGAANALVIASATNYAAYFAGLPFLVKVASTNTGAATMNLNNLGAKSIKKLGSAALDPGDLVAGQLVCLAYDGTYFQLLSPPVQGLRYAVATGADNSYAIDLAPAPGAYIDGMQVIIKANHTITGPATLNINELGAIAIKKNGSAALRADDIRNGQVICVVYDGANFQLLSPPTSNLQYAVATGADNAYAIALTPAMDAYIEGMSIVFKANHDNAGAATLSVDGMAAKAIKKNGSVALEAGDIKNGQIITVVYDGVNFQLINNGQVDMSQFGRNLGVTGYQKLPGGLIIQWGKNELSGSTTQVISLPIAFQEDMYIGVCQSNTGGMTPGSAESAIYKTSLSQISIQNCYTSILVIGWIVIGK